MSVKDTLPSRRRLGLIGAWVVAFLLFQLLLIYLFSALMYTKVESEFEQIAVFPQSSQKRYAVSYGLGQATIAATYLRDLPDREILPYQQQLQQHGWHPVNEIQHAIGALWFYSKDDLAATIEYRYKDHNAELSIAVGWDLSPLNNATRIAACFDVLIVLALLAAWRVRARRM
jgi:hypothetical protein